MASVLAVDDDADVLEAALVAMGYIVETASGGLAALAAPRPS